MKICCLPLRLLVESLKNYLELDFLDDYFDLQAENYGYFTSFFVSVRKKKTCKTGNMHSIFQMRFVSILKSNIDYSLKNVDKASGFLRRFLRALVFFRWKQKRFIG
jgi:hypothetical protein